MPAIGIVGASGQVGTEVCLYLQTFTNVKPVTIVRSSISGALLRRLGIEVREGSINQQDSAIRLLSDLDLVVDFSVPSASTQDIKAYYKKNIESITKHAPKGVGLVFISTINAFGMNSRFNYAKYYFLPHSVYAHTKRYGESLALKEGYRTMRPVWIFRLGHVHGLLQRVSQETSSLVRGSYKRFVYPATPSYTIFCYSIAEALRNAADGYELPGTYTVISNPAWSWRDVLHYYSDPNQIPYVELVTQTQQGFLWRLAKIMRQKFMEVVQSYRETIRANILFRFPKLEQKLQANYYSKKAFNEISEFEKQSIWFPKDIHQGIFPGKRLRTITDSRLTMNPSLRQVQFSLSQLMEFSDWPLINPECV